MRLSTYSGDKPYIFISYAHKDAAVVLPIVDALQKNGFRLWFDQGIEAGTEWPEYIAEHLEKSEKVIVFMSKAAADSRNCRREINYAIEINKEPLVVYLEEVQLTAGLKLQLNTLQAMFKYHASTDEEFVIELCKAKMLQCCREETAAAPVVAATAAPVQPTAKPVQPVRPVQPPVPPVQPVRPVQPPVSPARPYVPPVQYAQPTQNTPAAQPKKSGKGKFIAIAAVLVAVIAAVFVAVFVLDLGSDDQKKTSSSTRANTKTVMLSDTGTTDCDELIQISYDKESKLVNEISVETALDMSDEYGWDDEIGRQEIIDEMLYELNEEAKNYSYVKVSVRNDEAYCYITIKYTELDNKSNAETFCERELYYDGACKDPDEGDYRLLGDELVDYFEIELQLIEIK